MKIYHCGPKGVADNDALLPALLGPKFTGGPAMLSLTPDTNGPKTDDLRVLVGREFGQQIPTRATLTRTRSGFPILVEESDDDVDGAIVVFRCDHWVHRDGQRPNLTVGEDWAEVVGNAGMGRGATDMSRC